MLNFSFWNFIVSVWKCNRFLCVNFDPKTFPNSLMSSSSFLGIFRIFLVSCYLQTVMVLLLPSQLGFLLFFFFAFCGYNFKTMLNKSGEIGHPCLVPDLKGNAFSFSTLSMVLAVSLLYMAFFFLFPLCPFSVVFFS